jgi:hypothetical protein
VFDVFILFGISFCTSSRLRLEKRGCICLAVIEVICFSFVRLDWDLSSRLFWDIVQFDAVVLNAVVLAIVLIWRWIDHHFLKWRGGRSVLGFVHCDVFSDFGII